MAELIKLTLEPLTEAGSGWEANAATSLRAQATLRFSQEEVRMGFPCRLYVFLVEDVPQKDIYIRARWEQAVLWNCRRQEAVPHAGHQILKVAPIGEILEVSTIFEIKGPVSDLRILGMPADSRSGAYAMPGPCGQEGVGSDALAFWGSIS